MPGQKFLIALSLILLAAGSAHADLNAYIRDLNISAEGNLGGYKARVGAHFGTSGSGLDLVFRSVDSPAEAVLVLWIGNRTRQSPETVLRVYQARKGQGWGAIAKALGIKPGSADFHALKAGNLGWPPVGNGGKGRSKENGKKGKGRH